MTLTGPIIGIDPQMMRRHLVNRYGEEFADYALDQQRRNRNLINGTATMTMPDLSARRSTSARPTATARPVRLEPFAGYTGPWDFLSAMDLGRKAAELWPKPEALIGRLQIELEELRVPHIEDKGRGNVVMGRSFLPPHDAPKIQIANIDGELRQFVIAHELAHHFFPHLSVNPMSDVGETFASGVAAGWLRGTVKD